MASKTFDKMVMIPQREYDELIRQAKQLNHSSTTVSAEKELSKLPTITEKNRAPSDDVTQVETASEDGDVYGESSLVEDLWKRNWNQL